LDYEVTALNAPIDYEWHVLKRTYDINEAYVLSISNASHYKEIRIIYLNQGGSNGLPYCIFKIQRESFGSIREETLILSDKTICYTWTHPVFTERLNDLKITEPQEPKKDPHEGMIYSTYNDIWHW